MTNSEAIKMIKVKIKCMVNRALDLKDFCGGDYKLEYDKDYILYYVDVRRKDQK